MNFDPGMAPPNSAIVTFLGWWVSSRDPNSKVGKVTSKQGIFKGHDFNHLDLEF